MIEFYGQIVVYNGLGTFALKRGRTQALRLTAFAGALAVHGSIIAIARAHHPLGPLLALVQ